MQDYLNHLERLRKDAAECRLISDLRLTQPSGNCSIGWRFT